MERRHWLLVIAVVGLVTACGGGPGATTGPVTTSGQGGTPTQAAGPTTDGAPPAGDGIQIHLVLGGGPEEGTYDLTHSNPCQYNLPEDGDWRTTVTFPTATSGPSIIDIELPVEGTSFVDVYFGDVVYHAEDVEFTANDAGATASLSANGDATDPAGGDSFPLEITIQCDYIARY